MCCVKMILSSSSEYICDLFYLPPTKLREGNIFTGVCLFRGVGSYPLPTPPTYLLPNHLPPSYPNLPTYSPLSNNGPKRVVRILPECVLVKVAYLLPANEVWDKVMFLHCILRGGGGLVASRGSAWGVYPSPLWTE